MVEILDEDADRQAVDDGVEKASCLTDLPVRDRQFRAILHDRENSAPALEADFATIGQDLEYLTRCLEMRPSLGALDIRAGFDRFQHAFALVIRPDIEHRHRLVIQAGKAVECAGRFIDNDEAKVLRIIDPHRRRMNIEKGTEVAVQRDCPFGCLNLLFK